MKSKKAPTMQHKVLEYLDSGHTLDNAKAMAMWGYFRLSHAIHELRKKGNLIMTQVVKMPEGNTLSFYRKANLKVGDKVKVVSQDDFNGDTGVVLQLHPEDAQATVRVNTVKTPLLFRLDELEPTNA